MIPWAGSAARPFPPVPVRRSRIRNGLLAAGADLSYERLLEGYRRGIFPWFSEGDPILWWSPDPRMVLFPEELKISRSLGKTFAIVPMSCASIRSSTKVMAGCAAAARWRARHLDRRSDDRGLPESAPARIRALGRNLDRRGSRRRTLRGRDRPGVFRRVVFSRARDASRSRSPAW